MFLEGTLEQDILDVFKSRPLTVLEVWEALDRRNIHVPVLYLNKVLNAMVRFELLEKSGESVYQPVGLLSVRSISMKRICVNAVLAILLVLPMSGYCEDLSPVTLPEEKPPDIPPIITTRPSFTDSWLTIPKGSFQAENGATFTDNGDGTKSWILPETLLKVGVAKNTEIRFGVPNYTYLKLDHSDSLINNFGDISAGISHHVALPGKVDLAIIPFVNLPTGANKASSNSVDPQLRLVVAKYLAPKLVVSSQMDARWNTGRHAAARVVMNPTFISYYSFTNKLSGFAEYGGFIPTSGKSSHYIQGGALYLLTKRQQVDVRVAMGLNKQASDFLVGFGYSFRIDNLFK